MKKLLIGLSTILIVLVLVACIKDEGHTSDFEREEIQITHTITSGSALNEDQTGWDGGDRTEVTQTFKTNPENVVIFNYDILDMLDLVGIEKTSIRRIALPKGNIPSYLNKYNSNDYISAGSLFIPDWTALDLFIPDLIIIGGRSAGSYDRMKELYGHADILDVSLVFGEYLEGVARNAENIGKIFPSIKDDLAQEIASLSAGMDDVKTIAQNYKALFIMMNGEQMSFFPANGRFAVIHDEFGFDVADPNFANNGGSHGNQGNHEYIRSVNPQVILVVDRGSATGGGSSNFEAFLNNALIKETTAGINDDIYTLDPTAWYISVGGITSTRQMIQDLETFIAKYKNN